MLNAALSVLCLVTFAASQPDPLEEEPLDADAIEQEVLEDEAPGETPERDRFWFIGTSNYRIRLEESEADIDRLLNNGLGRLLLRWEEPETFKDWSDAGKIWDLWAGVGGDLAPRWSWSVYGGGGYGTVANEEAYLPLGLPLKLDIDFTRRSFLLGSSVTYYFGGRPQKSGSGLLDALKSAKPLAEFNLGYTHQDVIADVTAKLPLIGRVLHYKDTAQHDLLWVSPRIGLETPITERDSVNVLAGYLFFHEHAPEYNGWLFQAFYRRRF